MRIGKKTSMLELFKSGLIDTRVMNFCRRANIESVRDICELSEKYGSITNKFGPCKTAMTLQVVIDLAA